MNKLLGWANDPTVKKYAPWVVAGAVVLFGAFILVKGC